MIVRNVNRGQILGTAVRRADSFGLRLRGLMFRQGLGIGEGLVIEPCKAVHTHFMRFPIDVVFLDAEWRVVLVLPAMAPWRFSPQVGGARSVLELAAGAAGATAPGDQLAVE
ncbi:MAG: hypothetical protein JWN15_3804 [Firmicutes bacterium]|nr:hypothetical protein [Bacillota bacterium]